MQLIDKTKKIFKLIHDEYTGEFLFRNRWYPAYYIDKLITELELQDLQRKLEIEESREKEKEND